MSFSLESEVKFRITSWEDGEERLVKMGARIRERRCFERNVLFDFPKGILERRGEALRVRRARDGVWLTFKGPVHGSGRIKQRKEYETRLDDAGAIEEILQALGLSQCFVYEKYRAVYSLDEVTVSLDEAPMGFFLELEGVPQQIERAAEKLGLRMEESISLTYPRLYQMYREDTPQAPEFMIFPDDEGRR